jgi:soluble lytic murein transglycosylase-like protein
MSSFNERRAGYRSKLICVAYASVSVTALVGQVQDTRAAVFEQRCSGKVIVIEGGAPMGAPPSQDTVSSGGAAAAATSVLEFAAPAAAPAAEVSAGAALAAVALPPSSTCANPPAETPGKGVLALKTLRDDLSLPKPRELPQDLSEEQLEMRELAADVGLRFADAPGVRKADLDKATFIKLFTTLVHRESHFHARAVSAVGARGLGQLMPATARHLGVKNSFAPEQNLVGAATYLTEMLDTFGSPELALAAYNAGPAAVRRHGGIPPYRETRQYVADIFQEVLRDPAPSYVTARSRAATSYEPGLVGVAGRESSDPTSAGSDILSSVLAGKQENETDRPILHAFAAATTAPVKSVSDEGMREAVTLVEHEPSPEQEKEQAPESEMMGKDEDLVLPDRAPLPAPRPPFADLASLPEPRPLTETLQQRQITLRDLAVETALHHARAPGVGKAGLDERKFATLFVAVIRRESSFSRRAVSPDGAKGLGQLMPQTLRELGVKDAFSANDNLEAAATHFAALLEQFGSPALALAAYNAGPDKVLEEGGIPDHRNTRQFVADVLHDVESDPWPDFLLARLKEAAPDVPHYSESDQRPDSLLARLTEAAPNVPHGFKSDQRPDFLVALPNETPQKRPGSDERPIGRGNSVDIAARAAAAVEETKSVAMATFGGSGLVICAFLGALTSFLVTVRSAFFVKTTAPGRTAERVRRPVRGWSVF